MKKSKEKPEEKRRRRLERYLHCKERRKRKVLKGERGE